MDVVFPVSSDVIKKHQEECNELKVLLKNTKVKAFLDVQYNKLSLWIYLTDGKEALIFVPLSLRE